jgi:hypothetical protein
MTKEQKHHLRELAGVAYDRELSNALKDLFTHFEKWKRGEITAGELDREIHKHHNGISRSLYNLYSQNDPQMIVSQALQNEIIKIKEVREDCRSLFRNF